MSRKGTMSNKHKQHRGSNEQASSKSDQPHEGGLDDTKVRFRDDEDKTETRDPVPPAEDPAPSAGGLEAESESSEFPKPTGTDTGHATMAVVAPPGSGATASTAIGAGTEHKVDADNFNKETGFFEAEKK